VSFPLIDWAERFIATPSVSRDGNVAISELAAELCASVGLRARFDEVNDGDVRQRNLIVDAGPKRGSGDGVLLVTHLDTVPPGDPADWTATGCDPFRPTREGDRLFGLGSADAKVDLVCKVAALAELEGTRFRRRVRLAGTFGEEIGLRGARRLVKSGRTRGFRFALVGEPSELVAIHAHKGYAVYEARLPLVGSKAAERNRAVERFEGESAHSSTPHLGKNAIEMALVRIAELDVDGITDLHGGAGAVNQVPDRCRLAIGEGYPAEPLIEFYRAWRRMLRGVAGTLDANFDPDHTVGNLGWVEMRDGRPVFGFDLRPVPGVDPDEAVRPLEEVCDVELIRSNPPLATKLDGELVRAVVAAQNAVGLVELIGTKGTCTEAGIFSEAGLEAVVIGAGISVGNVHRPNEHTRIPELHRVVEFYTETLRRLAGPDGA
jgi:succinyl-diaminopimelate desuccinylase